MIKAVIFDMDGLLIDSEPLWKQTNIDVYKKLGVELTDADRHEMMGRTQIENAERLYAKYHWETYTPKQVRDMVQAAMVTAIKKDIKLMPGVHHVLQICKQAALPVAIASSSPMVVIDAVVNRLKLREHFEHIYSAQHEPFGKPHPGVFLSVANELKVPPTECLVFEDAPSGVLAAKAASMKCIAVPEPELRDHPYIKTADLILGSLEEFKPEMLNS
jgi:mannitol-1-/sugar-/sorbitol-6-/2-deoxyglucose-6-phosphatase